MKLLVLDLEGTIFRTDIRLPGTSITSTIRQGIAEALGPALDSYFLGLRPDYVLEVRRDILQEHDGPTLVHAIQALHGASITLPRQTAHQPRELLKFRYEYFRRTPAL